MFRQVSPKLIAMIAAVAAIVGTHSIRAAENTGSLQGVVKNSPGAPVLIFSKPASSGMVEALRVVTDAQGNAYVAGNVVSTEPSLSLSTLSSDVFVSRLDRDGNIVWTSYLRGSKSESVEGLATDPQGNIYVVGFTYSPDFPLANPFQREFLGDPERAASGFLAKLSGEGRIVYSTYLGGRGLTAIRDVFVDSTGSAFVTGSTIALDFPTTPGALVPSIQRAIPYAFVTRFSPSGNSLFYSTYLGGQQARCVGGSRCIGVFPRTSGTAITVDGTGNAFVAGETSAIDFPVTPGAPRTACGCNNSQLSSATDGFVAKLNSTGTALLYATYLGGSPYGPDSDLLKGRDSPQVIALDSAGNVYVAGVTESRDFPVTEGALQADFRGCRDPNCFQRLGVGFISKLDPLGKALMYSSYIGGTSAQVNGLALDAQGNLWVTGSNAGADFPVTPGGFPRGGDFITQVSATGATILASTQLPWGVGGRSIVRRRAGGVLVAGGESGLVSQVEFRDAPVPLVLGVGNAAAGPVTGRVAPGEIVSIYGIDIGSTEPASVRLDTAGRIGTNLNGVRVFFRGIVAPLLYTQRDQINAIVPYGIAGSKETVLEIANDGRVVTSRSLAVIEAEPEIFRFADGYAAALNQDGTINSRENPAQLGSVLVLYATGEGHTVPKPADGELVELILPRPALPVAAEVAGRLGAGIPVEILYAGAAPGLVAGLMQLNVRIPPQVRLDLPNELTIRIRVGNRVSHPAVFHARR